MIVTISCVNDECEQFKKNVVLDLPMASGFLLVPHRALCLNCKWDAPVEVVWETGK
jgi:hypothetical protein